MKRAVKKPVDGAFLIAKEGHNLFQRRLIRAANECLDRAVSLQSRNPRSLFEIGILAGRLGKKNLSKHALTIAILGESALKSKLLRDKRARGWMPKFKIELIEKFAKILCDIHGGCLAPFYCRSDWRRRTSPSLRYGWYLLPEREKNKENVDRSFFREMSTHILKSMHLRLGQKGKRDAYVSQLSLDGLGEIFFLINRYSYQPFYELTPEDNWLDLPKKVRKDFGKDDYRKLARSVLRKLSIKPGK